MIKEISYKDIKWVYASSPAKGELEKLTKNYAIHPVIADELSHPTLRPRVERFAHFLYLIMHFPVFDAEKQTSVGSEIDFVIGRNFLLTVSYEHNAVLDYVFKSLEASERKKEHMLDRSVSVLLHSFLSELYEFAMRELDHVKLKIDAIDVDVSTHEDESVITEIFLLRRDILNFRRAIKPHETVLDSLLTHGPKFFGEETRPYFQDIIGEYYKVWNALENHKETVEALYDTNVTYLSMQSNEVMKKLTLMAFVTFPLTLIAAIFSMNITPDEFFGRPYDFLIVFGIIIVAILGMLTLFKKRKWF